MGPMLDHTNKEKLIALLARRAGQYVPEWRFKPGSDDPGAAIAALFTEVFGQTVDRFNQLPEKHYVEFLKLLGVQAPSATPAVGNIQFSVGGAGEPVRVPKGTEIFAPMEGAENIVFSTQRSIEASGAKLSALYFSDTQTGHIEKIHLDDDMPFFESAGGENLQRHRFELSQNEVLSLSGPCRIEIYLKQATGALEEATAKRLADPSFASWSYFDGEEMRIFQNVWAEHGRIMLEKNNNDTLSPDEAGHISIVCDMRAGEGEITISAARLKSIPLEKVLADSLAEGSIAIDLQQGGYCFGRRPAAYGLFYIRSDQVFRKRGAQVSLHLDIEPVIYSAVDLEPQYTFNRRIIDKNDAVRVTPDDVFISQVIWEYYNGAGWAVLQVSGNQNPFSGQTAGPLVTTFEVPGDSAAATVNAQRGFYIRARVVHMENDLSLNPRWILPFVRQIHSQYQYPDPVGVTYIKTENNHDVKEIKHAAAVGDLAHRIYDPMPRHPRAMYLCFDASPHAMPLAILFDVIGRTLLESKILFEVWTGSRFEHVRALDGTQNLYSTGLVLLYITQRLTEGSFFGKRGYWLRMSLSGAARAGARMPHVGALRLNVAPAIQSQKAAKLYFDTAPYEAGKRIGLIETPVLDCTLWVDEKSEIGQEEMAALEATGEAQLEYENDAVSRCWIKWRQVAQLGREQAGARVYTLDAFSGVVAFGTGADGKVPPKGSRNLRVSYSFGGGAAGNLAEGRVSALVGSIPRITGVSNVAPMCGGADRLPLSEIAHYGNRRYRHRTAAVSTQDFEEMVLERFQRVAYARCFPAMDENGAERSGHVCLVIMSHGLFSEGMTLDLCREVYEYLAARSDCNLVAGGRLHVMPSVEITVNVEVQILVHDLDEAAVTQQQVSESISALIEKTWRKRAIGDQIDIHEIYRAIQAISNVKAVTRILPEGIYQQQGRVRMIALDGETAMPLSTAKNGVHTIRIGS